MHAFMISLLKLNLMLSVIYIYIYSTSTGNRVFIGISMHLQNIFKFVTDWYRCMEIVLKCRFFDNTACENNYNFLGERSERVIYISSQRINSSIDNTAKKNINFVGKKIIRLLISLVVIIEEEWSVHTNFDCIIIMIKNEKCFLHFIA